eukprot:TRINITY_DN6465_c0_g1_i1.p1 TRINITY_DN6465_c0_g1~~TRINITY_DN6465_c0_g1_i1.p1  ORF type:complete len:247 (+),score=2.85 TRINITY_DN6465_c0_g1_i1:368-1108(+)
MLAIFNKSVAPCPPQLKCALADVADSGNVQAGRDALHQFMKEHPGATAMHFDENLEMAFTGDGNRQFAAHDDIFCSFIGNLENLPQLRAAYGIMRLRICEAAFVIEVYKTLRDRAPCTVEHALYDFRGPFSFVLYDQRNRKLWVAQDVFGKRPLYWGSCKDSVVAISDSYRVLRDNCGRSFAPFPKGCYFSTIGGLNSFEHPDRMLKPIPHVDSRGQLCGSNFVVDQQKRGFTVTQVGSECDLTAI